MYGYIRPHTPELKVREQEYYRAVYCGLCRTMGKCTGQTSRMTLSYDFTFFALVRMALRGESPTLRRRRCAIHPTHRRSMAEPSDTLRLCANLSAILAYHKVRDDRQDERGLKRATATMATPYVATIRRRALKRQTDAPDEAIVKALQALSDLEAAAPASVDEPAERFGDLMACLLSHGLEGDAARLAHVIGRHVGRWVYILDAADDFDRDVEKGRYNPFICLYGDPTMTALPRNKREEIRTALVGELLGLEKAFDLLDLDYDPDLRGLLLNILYEGMPARAHQVLFDPPGSRKDKHKDAENAATSAAHNP